MLRRRVISLSERLARFPFHAGDPIHRASANSISFLIRGARLFPPACVEKTGQPCADHSDRRGFVEKIREEARGGREERRPVLSRETLNDRWRRKLPARSSGERLRPIFLSVAVLSSNESLENSPSSFSNTIRSLASVRTR